MEDLFECYSSGNIKKLEWHSNENKIQGAEILAGQTDLDQE